jgi:hypothetical protein
MTPSDHYRRRLAEREHSVAACARLQSRIGVARLALAAGFLVLAWCCVERHQPSALWLLLPGALFLALVVQHRRSRLRGAAALRSVEFYRAGLARLAGERIAGGLTGDQFKDEHHPYGADLDLFGTGSLYACLSTARTPMGEATLARWLKNPADLATLRERQAGIRELRAGLDLREELAVLGEPQRISLGEDALARWMEGPDQLSATWLLPTAALLAALAGAATLVWAVWGLAFPLLAVLVVEAGLNHRLRERVQRAVTSIEHAYEDIRLLAALLGRIEHESFESNALSTLRLRLRSHSQSASATLAKLGTVVNFIEARRNPFLAPLLLPLLYSIQSALAAERWRRRHGPAVAAWLEVLGEFEALQSLAGYSFERPDDPFPEFIDGPAAFAATGLGHPLLAAGTRVRNDVELCGATRVLMVSGSNMSGKSTLLRAVGMNAVLAMAGAPVCARQLRLTPLRVGASIRINDSLQDGSSRFHAEITRLRQLFEPSRLPLLFLLDELLQGTNAGDRQLGARGVVRALIERGGIGLISTHDLALTDAGDYPPGALRNVHFRDQFRDGKLCCDFTLRDGVVARSNGLELMRAIGLDV